ncbi:MAG: hypothetical protein QF797_15490 [Alphaproteobacteria bacterium]|nr:hypothetical protein [Alphaproteobacteria bacterium]
MSSSRTLFVALLVAGLASAGGALAGGLAGTVRDDAGKPVADAVIYATPLAGLPAAIVTRAVIDQVDKLYSPFVTAFRAGTTVTFPNKDNIKHHLYSVSPAKSFERPLYKGRKASPVVFDKPGEVTLGCNIHDWMIAHVLVLETPHAAVTDQAGRAVIAALPAGDYEVRVWHPGMKGKKKAVRNPRKITVAAAAAEVAFEIRLRPKKRWWRKKPKDADKKYSGDEGFAGGN